MAKREDYRRTLLASKSGSSCKKGNRFHDGRRDLHPGNLARLFSPAWRLAALDSSRPEGNGGIVSALATCVSGIGGLSLDISVCGVGDNN